MARDEPLLSSSRPSSENSDDRAGAEEDALLTGQKTGRVNQKKYGWLFWREVGLFSWALIATAALIIVAVLYGHQQTSRNNDTNDSSKPNGKRNLIFMVSDGMGPTSLSLTRSYRQAQNGLPIDDILVLDQYLIGSSRTRSTSSLITDSAAGATAFSCGMKSYNGAISILPDHTPCGTVLEAAKKAGYMTGLVVTTRLTDATPACFAAHVNVRDEEDRIAEQEIGNGPLGRVVDLMLGAGRCHFLPNSTAGSCRNDDKDVIAMAKDNDFDYVDDRKGFDGLNLGSAVKLPLLGLFADHDIPYEVDRRFQEDVYPSLDEMAQTALKALTEATRDSDKGFFLMIEGSRIDHAGHANDPVAQVHEVLAYDKAFASVLDFLDEAEVEGVVVSTSDHETGGLATARRKNFPHIMYVCQANQFTRSELHVTYPEYLWYPGVLANASHSGEELASRLRMYLATHETSSTEDLKSFINEELLQKGLGVYDASDAEIQLVVDHPREWATSYLFTDIISRRAQVGWSTHGHSGKHIPFVPSLYPQNSIPTMILTSATAVDVNIYASHSPHTRPLMANHENTEVGEFIRDYLDLDLKPITKKLQEASAAFDTFSADGSQRVSWMGRMPNNVEGLDELDHYHGDFKRSLHRHRH
ncbi:MAG: hypothetical protein M1827_003781 [Pycnora praestabilis]|nr:MAG: hypothetical protein M1827_003781 [Pycnora praestabilis]